MSVTMIGLDTAKMVCSQRGWMDSPGHGDKFQRCGLDRFGFGIIVGDDQALYRVQTFAGPSLPHGPASGEDPVLLLPEQ